MNKMRIPECVHNKASIALLQAQLRRIPSPSSSVERYKEAIKELGDSVAPRSFKLYPSKIMYNNKVYEGYLTSSFISKLFNVKEPTIYSRYHREGCCVYAMANGMCIFIGRSLKISHDNIDILLNDMLGDIDKAFNN